MTNLVTRLAPSPTGALHLGNARTFLLTWAIARQRGMRIIMRIEDLDGPRIKPDSAQQCLDLLSWLGIDYDGEIVVQSHDLQPYRLAMQRLAQQRLVFRCDLTRKEIEQAASAPHAGEHETRFPPELRPREDQDALWTFGDERANYRLLVPDRVLTIDDAIAGTVMFNPSKEIGDFVIWTRRGVPAYQLAVVVDDARQGVTHVMRGDDLLPSAARQSLLYEAFGAMPPNWMHFPLVVGEDGRRLAKRHGDTRLTMYRDQGVPAERVIGLLASWCGLEGGRAEISSQDFLARFNLDTLPRCPITFTPEDHAWLLSQS